MSISPRAVYGLEPWNSGSAASMYMPFNDVTIWLLPPSLGTNGVVVGIKNERHVSYYGKGRCGISL